MGKRNNMVPNNHFHKQWQERVKTWFSQPFDKIRRQKKRERKARRIAPRPEKGPLRPAVQCPSFRYNRRCRLGRGFSLHELKAAKINKDFAKTIGIAVDYRRRNKSYESLRKNKQRLTEYMNKIILFPKNKKKLQEYEANADLCKKASQLKGPLFPISSKTRVLKCINLAAFKDAPSAYKSLRDARRCVKKPKMKKKKKQKAMDSEDK